LSTWISAVRCPSQRGPLVRLFGGVCGAVWPALSCCTHLGRICSVFMVKSAIIAIIGSTVRHAVYASCFALSRADLCAEINITYGVCFAHCCPCPAVSCAVSPGGVGVRGVCDACFMALSAGFRLQCTVTGVRGTHGACFMVYCRVWCSTRSSVQQWIMDELGMCKPEKHAAPHPSAACASFAV